MLVIDGKPTINERLIIICLLGGRRERRGSLFCEKGRTERYGMPGFVWANEMKGVDLRTVSLVSWSIPCRWMRRTREDG
jgi:hypothetical protein